MDNLEQILQLLGSWIGYAAPLLAGFIYMISKIEGACKRIDATNLRIDDTNRRLDETIRSCNERADQLQKEFIELLKEVKNDRNRNRIL
jgi:hypothetical protein